MTGDGKSRNSITPPEPPRKKLVGGRGALLESGIRQQGRTAVSPSRHSGIANKTSVDALPGSDIVEAIR
jgi:hypothetical protein